MSLIGSASLKSTAESAAATGNVPYAAARDRELAEDSLSVDTKLGTSASLAGDHRRVMTSRASDTRTSPHTVSTKGRVHRMAARPKLHRTSTCLRFQRSTSTPPTEARKKPGNTRASITTPMEVPDEPPPASRSAIA